MLLNYLCYFFAVQQIAMHDSISGDDKCYGASSPLLLVSPYASASFQNFGFNDCAEQRVLLQQSILSIYLYLSNVLSASCIRTGCEGTFYSLYFLHLYSAPKHRYSLAVLAGLANTTYYNCCYYCMQERNPFGQPARHTFLNLFYYFYNI